MPIEQASIPHHMSGSPAKLVSSRSAREPATGLDRRADIAAASSECSRLVHTFIDLALNGLPRMHVDGEFGHTLRAINERSHEGERLEGRNLRYTANVALGIGFLPEDVQQRVLGGKTAA